MKRAPFFLGIGLAMLMAVSLPAQDCLYKRGADAPVQGKIEKVDDNLIYIRLGAAGTTTQPRAQIERVEIARPAEADQGLKAAEEGQAAAAIASLEPLYIHYRGLPQDWIEEISAHLGEAYVIAKDWTKAQALFAGFNKFYPQSHFRDLVLIGEAEALFAGKKMDEAQKCFEALLAEHEKEISVTDDQGRALGQACLRLGQIYAAADRTEEALESLLKTTTIYYQNPRAVAEALYESALMFEKLKDPARARGQLEELLKEFPNSPFTEQARKKLETLKSSTPTAETKS